MDAPTLEQVAAIYAARDVKIQEIKVVLEEYEKKQVAAEKFMLAHNPGVEQVAAIYVARRNEASALERLQKEIKSRQEGFEQWFANRMQEVGTDAFKTAAGTIYKYRSEAVTVGEWDTFVEQELLRPAANAIAEALTEDPAGPSKETVEFILAILRDAQDFSIVNKAVNKTAALERMGDLDEKTKGRPNPPPAGVNYRAEMRVGVRKS